MSLVRESEGDHVLMIVCTERQIRIVRRLVNDP